MGIIYVAVGGALGSVLRYLAMMCVGHYTGNTFPYGTLVINITGSIIMGLLIGWIGRTTPVHAKEIHLLIAVGVLGGYTTFSTFSLDAINLFNEGRIMAMIAYIIGSVACSLIGLAVGLQIMRAAIG